jgi:hypothetical protein
MITINDTTTPRLPISTHFSFTPWASGPALTYTINGETFPPTHQQDGISRASDARYASYQTPTNTPITFTGSAVTDPAATIIEYLWDFGDGSIGYGPTVTHTFSVFVPSLQVTLRVRDTWDRRASAHQILFLYAAAALVVGEPLFLSS